MDQSGSRNVPAILISGLANVRYLTGFSGDSSWLLLTPDRTVLLTDTRYVTQLAGECPGLELEVRDAGTTILELAAKVIAASGLTQLAFESDHTNFTTYQKLNEKLAGVTLLPTSGVIEELRDVKDEWELAEIRKAVRCAERAFQVIRSSLRPDQTEQQIRYLLEAAMRDFGGDEPAFTPIVGVGPTAALPHAHAGQRRVSESPVLLIDWGAALASGYRCDLTRVLITGPATDEMRRVYEVVLAAQQAAIDAIGPGVDCRAVDTVARDLIASAGYGDRFGHGLGHGFGLEIHESIQMRPTSTRKFVPGMVVTVEPGIYLPGQFGVRIEDDILVTETGCERLSSLPREFDAVCVDYLA
jgi:Xaa-Pro aminopeptidase